MNNVITMDINVLARENAYATMISFDEGPHIYAINR